MPKEHRTRQEWLAGIIRHLVLTEELRSILDGLLLSDGYLNHIKGRSTASLRLMQAPIRRGWLHQLRETLDVLGVETALDVVVKKSTLFEDRVMPERSYDLLRSLNYVELVNERQRWYPEGSKVVPRDLRLNPLTLTHWFCGDGRGGDRKGTLGFCTDGFHRSDVEFLVARLKLDLNIHATQVENHRGHFQILVGRRDEAVKVKELVSPHIPICCEYKLAHVRPLQVAGKGRRLTETQVRDVLKDRGEMTVRLSALKHGVSLSKVWTIWNKNS